MSSDIIDAVEANFDEVVLQQNGPVLVDFWAPWCGPCKAMSPVLEEMADEYDGRLTVVKVNVDDAPSLAGQYGVRGIPTLAIFNDGEVQSTKVGAQSRSQLQAYIDSTI